MAKYFLPGRNVKPTYAKNAQYARQQLCKLM